MRAINQGGVGMGRSGTESIGPPAEAQGTQRAGSSQLGFT